MKSFVVLLPQLENGYTSQSYCSVLTKLIDMVSGSKNHYKMYGTLPILQVSNILLMPSAHVLMCLVFWMIFAIYIPEDSCI